MISENRQGAADTMTNQCNRSDPAAFRSASHFPEKVIYCLRLLTNHCGRKFGFGSTYATLLNDALLKEICRALTVRDAKTDHVDISMQDAPIQLYLMLF